MNYLPEMLTIATIAVFMAISPGVDFVMITRNSIFYGRKAGIWSAVGISLALWVHVTYSIAGLALIISQSIIVYSIIKYCGAAYLIYLGWKTMHAKNLPDTDTLDTSMQSLSRVKAFKSGFICNVLNPKAPIFFMSIFTQVVHHDTPLWVQLVFGAIISVTHLLWFSMVALFLSQPTLLRQFNRFKQWIERMVGGVLILFGVKVAVTN